MNVQLAHCLSLNYRLTYPLLLLLTLNSCKNNAEKSDQGLKAFNKQDSLIFDNGLYIEHYDTANSNVLSQTDDNEIYKLGRQFVFNYAYYIGEKGPYLCDFPSFEKRSWEWVDSDEKSTTIANKIILTVQKNTKMPEILSQTFIQWSFENDQQQLIDKNWTGLVENNKNVWFHPPRNNGFKQLQINPFPHIVKPYKIGQTWESSIEIGSAWGDERWKEWEGKIVNTTYYQIVDLVTLKINKIKVPCWQIQAVSNSDIGSTKLTAYFNEMIGFVKLIYTNIDGSRLILSLESVDF